jgi:pantoate--beta-alanine ligase
MSVRVVHTVKEVQETLSLSRASGKVIGFVPTMGALHVGHQRLIETAKQESGAVVVSIFVNPLQFGPNEDYARYPKTLDADLEMCRQTSVDLAFAPSVDEMYPDPKAAVVDVPARLLEHLCGPFRPGHFQGVATVVLKLFDIVKPNRAYFGEKDVQQLRVIRRIVRDRNLPIDVVGVPTVREPDGLALSSRNKYLSHQERQIAPFLYKALKEAERLIHSGDKDATLVRKCALRLLDEDLGISVEYFEIVDPEELQPVTTIEGPVLIAAAAWVGTTRLIDNIMVEKNAG